MGILKRSLHLLRRSTDFAVMFGAGGVAYARRIGVQVGNDCRIYTTLFGSEPFLISIGDRVTITHGVKILTHDGAMWLARDARGRRFSYRPVRIGSDVFVGVNAIIMPGVVLGDRTIVAAGAVVTKSVPSGWIVGGVPARRIGAYADYIADAIRSRHAEDDWRPGLSYREQVALLVDPVPAPELGQDG